MPIAVFPTSADANRQQAQTEPRHLHQRIVGPPLAERHGVCTPFPIALPIPLAIGTPDRSVGPHRRTFSFTAAARPRPYHRPPIVGLPGGTARPSDGDHRMQTWSAPITVWLQKEGRSWLTAPKAEPHYLGGRTGLGTAGLRGRRRDTTLEFEPR